MNALHSSATTTTAFANRAAHADEERVVDRWSTAEAPEFSIQLKAPTYGEKVWAIGVPIKSSRQSMLLVDVVFDCGAVGDQPVTTGYRTSFVVEWSGWNMMHFTASSLEKVGCPAGLHEISRMRLTAGSTTFAGTVLALGLVSWLEDAPLVEVTPGEDMVLNFLHERMWDRSDWVHTGEGLLPESEQGFDVEWMYANLRYLQKPGRQHQTAYTRKMDVDISSYQAVTVWTATDLRANLSLVLEIDGEVVRTIDRCRGLGGGDEIRALISGRRLTALTFELEQAQDEIDEVIETQVSSSIRWVLLERKGVDPAKVGQVSGLPAVLPPARIENLESSILPVGIMIDREDFLKLRSLAQQPGPLKKMADEMIAEANTHLDYLPEQYVGRYLPVDLGNQGCERKISPAHQMYHLNSCMVYGAVAYALTGDLRHGQTARRGLFSALRCTTWQGGFPSRIPCGLPGYRAPFIEAATAECVAQCYEFIYPLLSDAERREVEDALYEKALPWIDMYLRYYGEGYLLHSNQSAVYMDGLVSAALIARRSHPDVDAILERNIQWFPRMMNNYYKENGASNEGPGYWEYTTQHAVAALIAICRHQGWRVQDYAPPHFSRTMDYLMHLRSLARDQLSFLPLSDNIEGVGYNFMNSSFMFFAKYYEDPNALWLWHEYYANRQNYPGSLFFGKQMAGACSLSGLMEFLLFVEANPSQPQLPPGKHFAGCDRIMLRTGCNRGDILFFFEGGPQSTQHTHNDKGQFIMEAYGERFAADPGVVRYDDPSCMNYKHTSYHNLATLKGRDQDYVDLEQAVVLDRVEFGERYDYIDADLRNSYRGFRKYQRRVLFVRPHYFLILDQVESADAGLEWNYHSCAPIEEIDLAKGLIRLQGIKAAMTMAIASDQALTAQTGAYVADDIVLTHNLVLKPTVDSNVLTVAALLLPFPLGEQQESEPQVNVESSGGVANFMVSGAWGTDRVRCVLDVEPSVSGPVLEVRRGEEKTETIFVTCD